MDITKLSVVELKALKCDEMEKIQMCQQNIQIINIELQKRQPAPKTEEVENG